MVPNQTTLPNTDEIHQDLSLMTKGWETLNAPVRFELRAFKQDAKPQIATFAPDWIDEAVEWCERMNELGFNIYSVRNPIHADTKGSASDKDIVAAFSLWADCDDDGAAQNVRRFDGPKVSAIVVTGQTPTVRVHTYWRLAEPCTDMAEWRAMQESIAAHFGSDRTVVNPSRIMRVAGTVTYPDSKKQARGYVKELTTLRTYDDRPAVTLDQMRRVFGASQHAAKESASSFQIDTGPQPLDRERTRIQALQGQEWHNAVIRLVASYVSKGLSDDEIHGLTDPLTLPGYTVEETRREVQSAINGARRKGWTPENNFTPNFDHAPAPTSSDPAPEATGWKVQTAADFTADFVAPEYLIEGVVQRGRLYTLTAPTGSGKTAVMLYAATAIAAGMQFCGVEVEQGDVLFLAGENPDDVRARVIATMDFYGIDPNKCRLHFVAGTFSIRADMERLRAEVEKLPNLVMVVVDTFAAYFDGEDENSNAQALDFARVVRQLTALDSKPAVIMPAHPVKNASRTNLAPKGGSSLVNEVDGNLTLWNSDGLLSLHWQVKHRGPDFDPLTLELERRECDRLKDRKGRIIPTILAKPVLTLRATQIARETLSLEDQILMAIHDDPTATKAARAAAIGIPATRYQRLIDRLRDQKLIKKKARKWQLTADGEEAIEDIQRGLNPPAELD